MAKTKVAVYGLSTEGYEIASQMAIKGADVHIIDESTPSAISLKPEIAKTYPDVSSLKEDEPLLSMEPIDVAISKAQYLFFTPRIRKTGQDVKIDINSKFKDAVKPLKKNSSVIYDLPVGFGGNNENLTLLEHVTGFETGRQISYYYYPISSIIPESTVVGSFNGKKDPVLSDLLTRKKEKKFTPLMPAEYFYAINILSNFSSQCSVLEICKFAKGAIKTKDLFSDGLGEIFLDDMVNGLFDLRSLGTSTEGANTMLPQINSSARCIDNYIKRLTEVVRMTLKKNALRASRTKVALSWTFDQYEMRSDKNEMLQALTARLRDYIGDVETFDSPNFDLFHSDKATIVIACSKSDYDRLVNFDHDFDLIIVKTNPLCETAVISRSAS